MKKNYSHPTLPPTARYLFIFTATLIISGLMILRPGQFYAAGAEPDANILQENQSVILPEGASPRDQLPKQLRSITNEPPGSTCENPYHIDSFPFEDFQGNTDVMGDNYSTTWVDPATAYLNGNDMVFAFTLAETSYLSGDLSSSQSWIGLIILDACPDPDNPPPVLELAGSASGNEASFENLTLAAGSYFAIVSSFPPPQTIDFTLNLQAVPVAPDPEFVITPADTEFNFSEAGIGALPETTDFVITNTGGGELKITDIAISGDEAFGLNLDNFDFSDGYQGIGLGEEYTFTLYFGPDAEGDYSADLEVYYQEADETEIHTVSLSGEGVTVLVNTFPFNEIFDQERFPPLGWSVVNGAEGSYWQRSDVLAFSGDYAAETYQGSDSNNLADEWLITPPIDGENMEDALFSYFGISSQEPEGNNARMRILMLENVYDNTEDLHIHAELLEVHHFSQSWNEFEIPLDDLPETFYLAFNYLVEAVDDADFNWMFTDDISLRTPAALHVTVRDEHTEAPLQGAYVNIFDDEGQPVKTSRTDAEGEAALTLDEGQNYGYVVRAGGYLSDQGVFTTDEDGFSLDVMLDDRIMEPYGLYVETGGMEPGKALFGWDYSEYMTFRYDDGTVTGQLGSTNATWNTVLGSAFRNDTRLDALSWYLTSEGGDHSHVKVWVIGLDAAGQPNPDDILYEAGNVPNENDQWNTHALSETLDAPNGYLIGLSYPGFLGLATDTGEDNEWPFQPLTHFFIGDIDGGIFEPIEELGDFQMNFLIRAHGYKHEALDWDTNQAFAKTQGNRLTQGQLPGQIVKSGNPVTHEKNREFAGYRVFLDDMEQPVAENITETSFLFEELPEGNYTAGVQSVYSSGSSDIKLRDFSIEEGFMEYFELSLHPIPEEGGQVSGEGSYEAGEIAPVSATPEDGYAFINWTLEDGTLVSNNPGFEYEMPAEDVSLYAHFDEETSLENPESITLQVFPNPAREEINIVSNVPIRRVNILDLRGRSVWEAQAGEKKQYTIHPGIRPGTYLLRIYTSEGITTETIRFK